MVSSQIFLIILHQVMQLLFIRKACEKSIILIEFNYRLYSNIKLNPSIIRYLIIVLLPSYYIIN
jgi:hypothetical protein